MILYRTKNPAEQVVKRAFFLAYEACAGTVGYGFLQAREAVTEEQVWDNVVGAGDYTTNVRKDPEKRPYGDYVFGRMMKLGLDITGEREVQWSDAVPRVDYQSWCRKYPTYESLVRAADESLVERN